MGRAPKARQATPRIRAAASGERRKVGRPLTYRDLFERLYFLSCIKQEVGIEIDGEWSPCWLWIGRLNREAGYPHITIRKAKNPQSKQAALRKKKPVPVLAHRLSYTLHTMKRIPPGQELRHLCHRSYCINPSHTVPGTSVENTADQYARGSHINQRERVPGEDDE